jgi:hypothetical protein
MSGPVSDGFRINISEKEASSEGRSAELLPRGDYHVRCTDGSLESCGPESKNPGKPYYNLEFTVQSGPHAGRKLFTNAMLFEGALYTIVQIMKSMGLSVTEGEMEVPSIDEIVSTEFIAAVSKQNERTVGEKTYDARNEIKGLRKYAPDFTPAGLSGGGAQKSGATSLMP